MKTLTFKLELYDSLVKKFYSRFGSDIAMSTMMTEMLQIVLDEGEKDMDETYEAVIEKIKEKLI